MARCVAWLVAVALAVWVGTARGADGDGERPRPDADSPIAALFSADEAERDGLIDRLAELVEDEELGEVPRLFVEPETMEALDAWWPEAPIESLMALAEPMRVHDEWFERYPFLHARVLTAEIRGRDIENSVGAMYDFFRYDPDVGREALQEPIGALLEHKYWKVRREAVDRALYHLGIDAVEVLDRATGDERLEVRRQAWLSLGALRAVGDISDRWHDMPAKEGEAALLGRVLTDREAGLALLAEAEEDPIRRTWYRWTGPMIREVADGLPLMEVVERSSEFDVTNQLARQLIRAERLATGEHPELLHEQ